MKLYVGDVVRLGSRYTGIPPEAIYIVVNGKPQNEQHVIDVSQPYHICYRLLGGKGGFGSLLRTIGNQIERTTNRGACRDLNGRRLRDVNNERKLKEWIAKAAERERDRQERRHKKREQLLQVPKHIFEDETYFQQKQKVMDDLQESIQVGISQFAELERKRKQDIIDKKLKSVVPAKKIAGWCSDELVVSDDDSTASGDSGDVAHVDHEQGKAASAGPAAAAGEQSDNDDSDRLSDISCNSLPEFLIARVHSALLDPPRSSSRNSCPGSYCAHWLGSLP